MTSDDIILTALDGAAVRDRGGVWYWRDGGHPIPGARDMTLSDAYPDLVIMGDVVLIPDVLVRENHDLSWVRACGEYIAGEADGEGHRTGVATGGWRDVWTVPIGEWDERDRDPIGLVIDGWRPDVDPVPPGMPRREA